ncbi:tyrosinase cofactor [Streptomyces uncialis]|uniref:apotyrosinase chaperone MelC1 n=1 Tax=Streptomyces uncialis TaxID=1048205 RepID=UPI002251EBE5|nr:tyrosinase cofactor [Streptomyces uncialis]MCX4661824.1 tyrosinase cofactor [Streptomyces uncialis]WST72226.1 tyrosinase cofactor [Streptomyces uncialis]
MSRLTRRQAVGAVTGVAAGIAVAGVATAWADTAPDKGKREGSASGGEDASFDEVFQGRRIQGEPIGGAGAHASGHGKHAGHAGHEVYRVLIDGRELQVMRHGKSGWSSAINHYERFATPLDAARTAVTTLKGASVVPFNPTA